MGKIGIWILGDQVYRAATSLQGVNKGTPIVFVESRRFCTDRPYHWQKLVLILSAMRHFAAELTEAGHDVHYFKLADDFVPALATFVKRTCVTTLRVMEPNDWDRLQSVPRIERAIGCGIEVTPNNQFLSKHEEFEQWAQGRKTLTMEYWYREMRLKHRLLIDDAGKPLGGVWNMDQLNRVGKLAKNLAPPDPFVVTPDRTTLEVIEDVHATFASECFAATDVSTMKQRFIWPVTPVEATASLRAFLRDRLALFGPYEDVMTRQSWSLWHSHLSVAMNCGLLHPRQIIDETLEYALPLIKAGRIPMNSLEGFIRQIIGWREFVRGIYWHEMRKSDVVSYARRNELHANHPLPDFYWTGNTEMACMKLSLAPVIDYGYSHHIPRLMVMSNFALLHGISPQAVNEWFIYAFADGYEWVTTPNVIGMSLYADGGIVATKPYAAGGAYVHRMSDYCGGCRYDPKQATGSEACPFTRAYWPFLAKHRQRFESNPRTSLAVRGLDRVDNFDQRQREMQTFVDNLPTYQVTVRGRQSLK